MSKCSYCENYHDPKIGTHKCSVQKEVKIKTTTAVETWDGAGFVDRQEDEVVAVPGKPIDPNCTNFKRMKKRWKGSCSQCVECQDDECKKGLEDKLEDDEWDEPIYLARPNASDGICTGFKQIPIEEPELTEGEKVDGKAVKPD